MSFLHQVAWCTGGYSGASLTADPVPARPLPVVIVAVLLPRSILAVATPDVSRVFDLSGRIIQNHVVDALWPFCTGIGRQRGIYLEVG